ncbi:MAG: penicillin acylase family protein, partial [Candidatus Binatia bacterium]|nr:penicillin acylase family protein [Candidatus Binatia bacterium]
PCARLICDLGTSHAAMVLAGGVSGVSSSVHFADQSASFNEGRLTSFPVDDDVQGDLSELLP